MEFAKKLLPLLLIAIVFAVGGYFIGKGATNDQAANLYTATGKASLLKSPNITSTGPTGGDVGPKAGFLKAGILTFNGITVYSNVDQGKCRSVGGDWQPSCSFDTPSGTVSGTNCCAVGELGQNNNSSIKN